MSVMRHLDDSRCADLALGLLAGRERDDAVAHAVVCAECAVRLRHHIATQERWVTESGAMSRPGRRRHWPAPLAAAAALIAVLTVPRIVMRPAAIAEGPRLVAPAEGVLMREGESEDPHLRAGLEAYAAGDLERAELELGTANAAGIADEARRLYLAQVKLLRGDEAAALGLLRGLRWEALPSHVSRDAVALYARVLRASGRPASADSLEQALEHTPEWQPLRP